MIKTERHFVKGNKEILRLCSESKDLYNRCNYLMRQAWFSQKQLPDISFLFQFARYLDCFKNLHNTKTATQTVRKCLSDWSNFKKALNVYKQDPGKFLSKPRPPKYKEKLAQIIFFSETIKRKPLKSNIIQPTNFCFSVNSEIKDFKQVVVTPKTFGFVVEISYEVSVLPKSKEEGVCCIDIGLNNLCSITSDQHSPILINGRIVKSINQYYNKYPTKKNSKKRYFRLENYFHHVSKLVISNCLKYKIGTIIIGKNKGWKQELNLGKKTNQNFCFIPFYKLIQKIEYKAKLAGIRVVFTEESFTSKASFLDLDPLPVYEKGMIEPEFSGKRVKRGLYKSKEGILVNADVNGSLNIGRKVIQNSDFIARLNRSLAARPVIINPLRKLNGEGLVVNYSNL